LRIAQAQPILEEIKNYLNENITTALPKSPIGMAISYTLARWDKLCLYAKQVEGYIAIS
jgi:transposase